MAEEELPVSSSLSRAPAPLPRRRAQGRVGEASSVPLNSVLSEQRPHCSLQTAGACQVDPRQLCPLPAPPLPTWQAGRRGWPCTTRVLCPRSPSRLQAGGPRTTEALCPVLLSEPRAGLASGSARVPLARGSAALRTGPARQRSPVPPASLGPGPALPTLPKRRCPPCAPRRGSQLTCAPTQLRVTPLQGQPVGPGAGARGCGGRGPGQALARHLHRRP